MIIGVMRNCKIAGKKTATKLQVNAKQTSAITVEMMYVNNVTTSKIIIGVMAMIMNMDLIGQREIVIT